MTTMNSSNYHNDIKSHTKRAFFKLHPTKHTFRFSIFLQKGTFSVELTCIAQLIGSGSE